MLLLRTALAIGALAVSVPAIAQNGRYGWDRSRAEGRGEGKAREDRQDDRRAVPRGDGYGERGNGNGRGSGKGHGNGNGNGNGKSEGRIESRVGGGGLGQWERREPPRGGDARFGRRDDDRPLVVRPPVVFDRHRDRFEPRPIPIHRGGYRYGDRDFRNREIVTISAWFRSLPPARLSAYGYYGPAYGGIRYAFRPGLYLSFAVFDQLAFLPYELEEELGDMPWYLERRIYGNTVMVIDTRTRMIVDIFELDY